MELRSQSDSSLVNCLMFDLDDTLYPVKTGIAAAVKRNIEDFLVEECAFSEAEASYLRVELFKTYGSTLAGLRALGYDVDADDYHGFVHGRLPYETIQPDTQLRDLLLGIKQRKIIFTNSDRKHAMKVLERLRLEDCFEQIICFETMNPHLPESTSPDEHPVVLKPSVEAMKVALRAANIDPRRTLFLDDSARNIAAGKALGLRTVLVGKTVKVEGADYAVEAVTDIAQVVTELPADRTEGGERRIRRNRSELQSVLETATVGA